MGGLFQHGQFRFNSGLKSPFKLECDKLTDSEIQAIALVGSHQVCDFSFVHPVPKGLSGSPIDNAKRFAAALERYARPGTGITVLVDDVWTTGGSMNRERAALIAQNPRLGSLTVGWVAFAYGPPEPWTTAFMIMSPTVGLWVR